MEPDLGGIFGFNRRTIESLGNYRTVGKGQGGYREDFQFFGADAKT